MHQQSRAPTHQAKTSDKFNSLVIHENNRAFTFLTFPFRWRKRRARKSIWEIARRARSVSAGAGISYISRRCSTIRFNVTAFCSNHPSQHETPHDSQEPFSIWKQFSAAWEAITLMFNEPIFLLHCPPATRAQLVWKVQIKQKYVTK